MKAEETYNTSETRRVAGVCIEVYLFAALYSPGKGPVLVTSYAKAFPLYIREVGMSLPLRPFGPVNHLAFKPQRTFRWVLYSLGVHLAMRARDERQDAGGTRPSFRCLPWHARRIRPVVDTL